MCQLVLGVRAFPHRAGISDSVSVETTRSTMVILAQELHRPYQSQR